jgi:hypothetical protein
VSGGGAFLVGAIKSPLDILTLLAYLGSGTRKKEKKESCNDNIIEG